MQPPETLLFLREKGRRDAMAFIECVLAIQTSGGLTQTSNSPAALYFVIALVAVVLGLVVLIFIRTSARRPSK
jgi:hypothetical protein